VDLARVEPEVDVLERLDAGELLADAAHGQDGVAPVDVGVAVHRSPRVFATVAG
jgi:hypothetical protein